jgi:hypothetical protein
LTALARTFTPLNMRWRASSLNLTSFAAIVVDPAVISIRSRP